MPSSPSCLVRKASTNRWLLRRRSTTEASRALETRLLTVESWPLRNAAHRRSQRPTPPVPYLFRLFVPMHPSEP